MPPKPCQIVKDLKKSNDFSARNYAKIVEWSDEGQCFIGSAPPLIGQCCHGSDQSAVYCELCQIVEEWITIYKEDRRPLPPPRDYSGKFLLRIDPALHRLLATRAERTGESLNNFVAKKLQSA